MQDETYRAVRIRLASGFNACHLPNRGRGKRINGTRGAKERTTSGCLQSALRNSTRQGMQGCEGGKTPSTASDPGSSEPRASLTAPHALQDAVTYEAAGAAGFIAQSAARQADPACSHCTAAEDCCTVLQVAESSLATSADASHLRQLVPRPSRQMQRPGLPMCWAWQTLAQGAMMQAAWDRCGDAAVAEGS